MFSAKFISIVVPVYNAAPYIEKCLRSLVAQDYDNIEIIVVDDGSTDGSGDVVEELAFEKARLIRQPNGGVSRARNTGIKAAQGEYIIFVDGDDWVESNYVSTLINPLENGIDGAITELRIDQEEDQNEEISNKPFRSLNVEVIEKEDFNKLFDSYRLSSPCGKVYKKNILSEFGIAFDEKISYAEDLIFNLEYFKHLNKVAWVHHPTYHYVKHPASSTSKYHANAAYTTLRLCEAGSTTIKKQTVIGSLIYQTHFLWAIINLFHKDCPLSRKEKTSELKTLLRTPLFGSSSEAIKLLTVSRLMKMILKTRSPHLIYLAFSIRK